MCNVAQEINKRGIHSAEILVLTCSCEQLEKHCTAEGITLYKGEFYNTCYSIEARNLGFITSKVKFCINWLNIKKLDYIFRKKDYNIIHSNSIATLVGAMLAKRQGIAHVWHIREFLEEDYNSMQYSGRGYKELLKYTSKFIAISNAVANKYSNQIPAGKIQVIYNGIPFVNDSFVKKCSRNKMIFAISGVIRREKGILEAIQAFNLLQSDERVKESNLETELWIIGGDLDNKSDPYIQEVTTMGMYYPNKIKFLGYRRDILNLMKFIDVGLVCSRMEAFGRITIEYMQNNIYVIGARSGGTAELIENNVTGSLYKPGDAQELEEKMLYCLLHPEIVKKIGDNAKKYAVRFSIENCVDGILKVYNNIFSNKGGLN